MLEEMIDFADSTRQSETLSLEESKFGIIYESVQNQTRIFSSQINSSIKIRLQIHYINLNKKNRKFNKNRKKK
jgi:hypothetical protein